MHEMLMPKQTDFVFYVWRVDTSEKSTCSVSGSSERLTGAERRVLKALIFEIISVKNTMQRTKYRNRIAIWNDFLESEPFEVCRSAINGERNVSFVFPQIRKLRLGVRSNAFEMDSLEYRAFLVLIISVKGSRISGKFQFLE